MRLEAFFEKFELFADAPDAVAKMRVLVLELAVRGKLVTQDHNDEPASRQLQQIAEQKIETGRVSRVKAGRTGASHSIELAQIVPRGWATAQLADLVSVLNGRAYAKDELLSAGTPVLRVGNLFTSKHWYYSDLQLESDKYCDQGDLIFAWSASFGPFIWTGPKVIYHYHIWKLELHSERSLSRSYLYWFLQNKTQEIKRSGHGVSMLHMTKEKMEKLEVMVPPLAEQKRIVAKVDELMALCDRLEAQQQERDTRHAALARAALARFAEAPTPANLSFLFHPSYSIAPANLRKSILTLAVQGKLVPQDPSEGSARDLLDRALKKRQQTIQSKNLRRKQLDESTELFLRDDLPASWCVERIAKLVDPQNTISYGVLVPGSDVADGIPFVRAQDLSLSNHPARPNKTIAAVVEKPYARTRLRGGEILLCVVGSIGKLGVAPESWAGANIARAVARIKPIPEIDRDYLLIVLQEETVQSFFASSTRTLAQPTLNVGLIEQTSIPIPPLAEQHRIVAKVNQLMALVDRLEAQLAEAKTKVQQLLDAAIHELLNPRAEIIEFPRNQQRRVWDRAAIGCYIVRRMAGHPSFGRTMLMKLFYLSETHLTRSLGGEFLRYAAGPWDPWIEQFEALGVQQDWFEVISPGSGVQKKFEYRPKAGLEAKASEAGSVLGDQQPEFDRLLELFSDRSTEEAEIIATLFAAWNDALIDGQQPGDGEIIKEVRENWHAEKARFKPAQLQRWLEWMRAQRLVPKGGGLRTVQQKLLPLR